MKLTNFTKTLTTLKTKLKENQKENIQQVFHQNDFTIHNKR